MYPVLNTCCTSLLGTVLASATLVDIRWQLYLCRVSGSFAARNAEPATARDLAGRGKLCKVTTEFIHRPMKRSDIITKFPLLLTCIRILSVSILHVQPFTLCMHITHVHVLIADIRASRWVKLVNRKLQSHHIEPRRRHRVTI